MPAVPERSYGRLDMGGQHADLCITAGYVVVHFSRESDKVTSIRLDKSFAEQIRQLAKRKGITVSELHRQALTEYWQRETEPIEHSRFDDVIGIAASDGDGDLSENHRQAFVAALTRRSNAGAE